MPSKIDISHARAKTIEVARPKMYRNEFRGTPDCGVWLDHRVQAVVGDCLKASYEPIVMDTVPAALLKLPEELDRKQRQ